MAIARTRRLLPLLVFSFGLLLVAGAAIIVARQGPGAPQASAIGGPFDLVDQDGHPVSNETFKGKPTLVFFGYTHCPDVCPTTLFEMSEILRKMPDGDKAQALFITVDPARDTAAAMKDYLSSFDRRIAGLTGDQPAIDKVLKEYRVYAKKVGEGGDYTMDHSAVVYLMDKQMRFVNALDIADADRTTQEIRRWM